MNTTFESMDIARQKLSLIERLMKVNRAVVLEKVESLLIHSEMEIRAEESIKAIQQNETITLDQFTQNNKSWIKGKATK